MLRHACSYIVVLLRRLCSVASRGIYIASSFFTTSFLVRPESCSERVYFSTILVGS